MPMLSLVGGIWTGLSRIGWDVNLSEGAAHHGLLAVRITGMVFPQFIRIICHAAHVDNGMNVFNELRAIQQESNCHGIQPQRGAAAHV